MPHRRFDWHEHIKDVEGEYRAVRRAVDEFVAHITSNPDLLANEVNVRSHLRDADLNLEGTYIVRLFAAFESALRSFDRSRRGATAPLMSAAVLIDSIAGRRGRGISQSLREGAHHVRQLRNFWAHEAESRPELLTLAAARARLQKYLAELPEQWPEI